MSPSKQTVAAIRFGYGFHPNQTPPRNADDLMASLAPGAAFMDGIAGPSLRARAGMIADVLEVRRRNNNDAKSEEVLASRQRVIDMFGVDVRRRILTSIRSPHGFYERLAWFWADHFSVRVSSLRMRSLTPRLEPDAIRPHVNGSFRMMLRSVVSHPAMLDFLNQVTSMGPNSREGLRKDKGLNENLAREVIELHTLGVGAKYSQADVRQFAELLTGLTFELDTGETKFRARRAEPGVETVLGTSYGSDGRAQISDIYQALDDLAAHPATARHIATKLARHFTSDDPSEALIDAMAAAFIRSDGDLPTIYAAMLDHPDSWSSFGQKVKQPFDFVVSALRSTGLINENTAPDDMKVAQGARPERPLNRMGQAPYSPPGPHGWPEEAEAWITAPGLAERIEWATRVARRIARQGDPRSYLDFALGDYASDETSFAATRAAERWEGIAFVLASPEFNRR